MSWGLEIDYFSITLAMGPTLGGALAICSLQKLKKATLHARFSRLRESWNGGA